MLTAAGSRLQPLAAASRSPAGARTSPRDAGASTSSCATSQQRRASGRRATSRPASSPTPTRWCSAEDRAEIRRRDGAITTTLEVVVSPEDDAEVRRRRRSRTSGTRPREIEVTSYAEIVLAPPAADAAHPAFSNLFVQTEFVAGRRGAARDAPRRGRRTSRRSGRRTSSPSSAATVGGAAVRDRPRALPRPRPRRSARRCRCSTAARCRTRPGRCSIRSSACARASGCAPGASAHVTFSTVVAASREAALDLADKYHDPADLRARRRRWPGRRRRSQLHHLGIEPERGAPLPAPRQPHPATPIRRCGRRPTCSRADTGGPSGLWAHGISGDLPDRARPHRRRRRPRDRPPAAARARVLADEAARRRPRDPERAARRRTPQELADVARGARAHEPVRRSARAATARAAASSSCARDQRQPRRARPAADGRARAPAEPPRHARRAGACASSRRHTAAAARRDAGVRRAAPSVAAAPRPALEFFNGLGGFAADGREYVTVLGEGQWTPAPWINVIANPTLRLPGVGVRRRLHLGGQQPREPAHAVVERSRSAIRPARSFYVRDEETRRALGPDGAAHPRGALDRTSSRHGQGYSRLRAHLARHRARPAAVRAGRTTRSRSRDSPLANRSGRTRRLVGDGLRRMGARRVARERPRRSSSPSSTRRPAPSSRATRGTREFGGRVAFADLRGPPDAPGRATAPSSSAATARSTIPAALERGRRCSGHGRGRPRSVRRAADRPSSCAPGERGRGRASCSARPRRADEARALVDALPRRPTCDAALRAVERQLGRRPRRGAGARRPTARSTCCSTAGCSTRRSPAASGRARRSTRPAAPTASATSCRTCMALTVSRPRSPASTCCAPRRGSSPRATCSTGGTRRRAAACARASPTTCVWLPYAAVALPRGDRRPRPCSTSSRAVPRRARRSRRTSTTPTSRPPCRPSAATLFEHCARALDRSLRVGQPRPAADGHRRLERRHEPGRASRARARASGSAGSCTPRSGSSPRWPSRAARRERAAAWRRHAAALAGGARARTAWDGDWYRRAYFDDGTPLGSAQNDECRIDSIAQSWAVISGAARARARATRAMAAVEEHLVRRGDGLVLLFTPPFDQTPLRSRLHQGLPAGRPRERRTVHARGPLGGARLRRARRRRQGGRAVRHPEPDQPHQHARRRAPLQGRAVRRGGRRLRRAAARRARRLDLVHGVRRAGCTAPASSGSSASACAGRYLHLDPCIPRAWRGYRDQVPLPLRALRDRRRESPGVARGVSPPSPSTGGRSRTPTPSRWWTTARRTRFASCSGDGKVVVVVAPRDLVARSC